MQQAPKLMTSEETHSLLLSLGKDNLMPAMHASLAGNFGLAGTCGRW